MFDDKYKGITLDEAAYEAGGYVACSSGERNIVEYDMRELSRYCRERNVEPFELSDNELIRFLIHPTVFSQSAV